MFINDLSMEKEYVIYGTEIIAVKETIGFERINLLECVVTNTNINISELEGIKVYSIDEIAKVHKDAKVLLAVRERHVKNIRRTFA